MNLGSPMTGYVRLSSRKAVATNSPHVSLSITIPSASHFATIASSAASLPARPPAATAPAFVPVAARHRSACKRDPTSRLADVPPRVDLWSEPWPYNYQYYHHYHLSSCRYLFYFVYTTEHVCTRHPRP